MAAKDGSASFDFAGTYTAVDEYQKIEYTIEDGRIVNIFFDSSGEKTRITGTFEAESIHPKECNATAGRPSLIILKNIVSCNNSFRDNESQTAYHWQVPIKNLPLLKQREVPSPTGLPMHEGKYL
ncbi:hypothetical protein [uncultured Pedobacter sp.]|uniref:hypothetical protein n=1 Tax=uncultured Pedobacter sp. TaxID=246139 RepID=UPI0025D7614E|nr:hypothetical protein [uncultured Pedobacter sp.]